MRFIGLIHVIVCDMFILCVQGIFKFLIIGNHGKQPQNVNKYQKYKIILNGFEAIVT